MSYSSTISSKGQVTVPIEIRKRLGVREGDRLEFVVEHGVTILRPVQSPVNPFAQYVACLPAFENIEAITDWVKDLREDELANSLNGR